MKSEAADFIIMIVPSTLAITLCTKYIHNNVGGGAASEWQS